MDLGTLESVGYLTPELLLTGVVLLLFVADLFVSNKEFLGWGALLGVTAAVVALSRLGAAPEAWLMHRMVVHDHFAIYFKILTALSAVATIWMSLGSAEVERAQQGEYYGLLVASLLGMFLMAGSTNLLMAYLSLELVSLTSYILVGYRRHDQRACEASLKYLVYGGVASGLMIYGFSWIFGLTGSLDYAAINTALTHETGNQLALFIAVLLTLAGFGYKIAAVPFHMWAPDVYTGAAIPVTTFLSVGSKAAGFALLLRFFYPVLSTQVTDGRWTIIGGFDWPQIVILVSMISMTIGNLAALQQDNLKRLLAYSGVAHAGYILMGVVALSEAGLRAALFYMAAYYLMNIGAFIVVMVVANSTGREDIEGLRGLAWRGGAAPAVAMAVCLFSLAGIPPMAGFIGKFYLFAAVMKAGLYWLALIGALNSVVALYYYARVIRTMFLDFPTGGEATVRLDFSNGALLWLLTGLTMVVGLYWMPIIAVAERSARFFQG